MKRLAQGSCGKWRWASGPPCRLASAAAEWEERRAIRATGAEPRDVRTASQATPKAFAAAGRYTVRKLVDGYLEGQVDVHRKKKGAATVRRVMDRRLGNLVPMLPPKVTQIDQDVARRIAALHVPGRSLAFEFLERRAGTPVQTKLLKQELGAAWH